MMARCKTKKAATISEVLKRAIAESGMSYRAIEKATGVNRQSVARFVQGSVGLQLSAADRLAAYLGLELRPARKGG